MNTVSFNSETIERAWHLIDLEGQTLGRAASRIALVLRGKHRPEYTPHADCGDYVVIVNADKVRLTGNKLRAKNYYKHTGYMGGIKSKTAAELLATHPERVITKAVTGMLPRGPLGRHMAKKLKVYAGPDHPHAAQKPQPLDISR